MQSKQATKSEFFSLAAFIKENKYSLCGIVVSCIVAVVCTMVYLYGMKFLIDDGLLKKHFTLLMYLIPIMSGSIVIEVILNYLISFFSAKISQNYIQKNVLCCYNSPCSKLM